MLETAFFDKKLLFSQISNILFFNWSFNCLIYIFIFFHNSSHLLENNIFQQNDTYFLNVRYYISFISFYDRNFLCLINKIIIFFYKLILFHIERIRLRTPNIHARLNEPFLLLSSRSNFAMNNQPQCNEPHAQKQK